MTEGPLNESELEWLEETLTSYGHEDASVIDVSELDGMLTALLSGPFVVEPDAWLVAVWGGEKYIPRWKNDREMNRFIDLCFKHLNDIAERLSDYPDQFEPVFGINDVDGQSYTVVEEWCYGYMRGVALTDWSALPDELQADLAAIALHGTLENSEKLESLTEEEYAGSIERIRPAALRLYNYWVANPQAPALQQPIVNGVKVGRNDPCPCGSGKKFKSCCLH
ncbi:YecA family protein [Enterobacteriaceae bacterium 155047]|uniref:YecA/YgfB family protein n=1 Tax=Huaxiibacter chinensis TaxID=2899785 RepID=UPI0007DAB004|nr:YecA family protein [Huaxiibacter chinensis]ANG93310.1 YecA family protein [Lelliottia amnigena]MCG5044195.1 YecA family protein [Huaxiibacter chinensis]